MDMEEVVSLIALIIYFLYPWLTRRRKQRDIPDAEPEPEQAPIPSPAAPRPTAPEPLRARSEEDLLQEIRSRTESLHARASTVLKRFELNPRLARLVDSIRIDALEPLEALSAQLDDSISLSTLMQESEVLQELEELVEYLQQMARQRLQVESDYLTDADALADACYAPLIAFCESHEIPLRTTKPFSVPDDWDVSIVLRLASSSVAPLRVPAELAKSLWRWPAIAYEVAQDFYYSVDDLEVSLHRRLGLPLRAHLPSHAQDVNEHFLRQMFGPWLATIFADVMATWMLGPAYVETMRRAYARTDDPPQAAAVLHDGTMVGYQPPAHLRLYIACRVLHHLGHHQLADSQWSSWKRNHQELDTVYMPVGQRWAAVPDTAFTEHADALIHTLLEESWPELAQARLLSIPDLPYLHAEHAKAVKLGGALRQGRNVHADPRLVISGAVLAVAAHPSQHRTIFQAARRSILGVETPQDATTSAPTTQAGMSLAARLTQSLRSPDAIAEAVVLGAALAPRHHR